MTSTLQSQAEDTGDDPVFVHHARIVEAGQYAAEALLHFRDCLGSALRDVPVGAAPAEWIAWAEALDSNTLRKQLQSTFLQPVVSVGDSVDPENDDFGSEGSGQGSSVEEDGSDSSGTYRVDSDGDVDTRADERQDEGEESEFLAHCLKPSDPRDLELRRLTQVETQSQSMVQDRPPPPAAGGAARIDGTATVPPLPAVAAEGRGRPHEATPWPDVELDQSFDVSDFEKLSGAEDGDGDELE